MNEIEQDKSEALSDEVIPIISSVILIENTGDYERYCDHRKLATRYIKTAHEKYDGDISVAHNHHKSLLAKLKEIILPAEKWIKTVDRRLVEYTDEQERIRRAEEMRLQEIARRQEEERKLAEAIALESQGEKKEAEAVMQEPAYVPPVIIQKSVPKVQGVSYSERWKFRVVSEKLIPREYLMINMPKIGQVVRAMKSNTTIPGIAAYPEKSVSGRA